MSYELISAEQDEKQEKEQQDNLVATYMRILRAFPLLPPRAEFDLAARIEQTHQQLMRDYCSIRSEDSPELAGYDIIAAQCAGMPEEHTKLKRIKAKILGSKKPQTIDRLAGEAFQILGADRYEMVRAAASYITTTELPATKWPCYMTEDKWFEKERPELYHTVVAHHNKALKHRSELVRANLRLVVSISKRFNYGKLPFIDLIQEGNIGLMKAVDRYDHRRGYRFSTYASWWICHAISRAIADHGRTIRLPVHVIDRFNRINKAIKQLTGHLGRRPMPEELSKATGIPIETIVGEVALIRAGNVPYSLNNPVNEHQDNSFVDFLQDMTTINPLERIEDDEEIEKALRVLNDPEVLKPAEAEILRRRFGLYSGNEETLAEIGDDKHLSRERIRQIQERALYKMRRGLRLVGR